MKKLTTKHSRSIFICVAILAIVSVATYLYLGQNAVAPSATEPSVETQSSVEVADKIVRFAAMGDMLAHDTIVSNAKVGTGYDFAKYFSNIRSSYNTADVIFCNQEGLSSGEAFKISGYPSFNAPSQFADGLSTGAGCNMISLANNHIGDKSTDAIKATIDHWKSLNPLFINGANISSDDQNTVSYNTVNGIKIGFLAFADYNNNKSTPSYAVNIYHNQDLLERLVKEARLNADVVVVSMHWGTEDAKDINQDQIKQAKLLASLNVDVVLGTGPHVLQRYEELKRSDGKEMSVWYSLGNMLSSQLKISQLISGIAKFDIVKSIDNNISIQNIELVPTYMHYDWTATQAANGDLSSRKNPMIYLLNDAAEPLSRSLFNTSILQQRQYIIDTLGSKVTVK